MAKKKRGCGQKLVDVTDEDLKTLRVTKSNTFSKTGIRTGLYLKYHNKDYVLRVMREQKFDTISQAINFIVEKMAELENKGEVEFEKPEPTQAEDGSMDIFEWLTN